MILTDVIQSRVVRDFLCILMTLMTDGSVFLGCCNAQIQYNETHA